MAAPQLSAMPAPMTAGAGPTRSANRPFAADDSAEPAARHDPDEVRVHDREGRAADPVEDRCDEGAVPVRERQERAAAGRTACPRRDDERLPSEPIGRETERHECERGGHVAETD